MNSKNIATTKNLGVKIGSKKDMNFIGDNDVSLLATVPYELVASDDFAFNSIVSFKKGEKKFVTGMLAEQVIRYSEGIVRLVNEEQEKQDTKEAQTEARLKALEESLRIANEKVKASKKKEVVEDKPKTTKGKGKSDKQ